MNRVSIAALAVCLFAPVSARAADPALSLRVEAGGAGGLREEISEHGLAVHFGGRITYRIVDPIAVGLRVGGSFFPPAGTDSDLAHGAYELGVTAHIAKGLWADGYLGYHDMSDQGGFGFDISAGYDLTASPSAGVGPFIGYSLAALDETEHFLKFGIGGSFGLPGAGGATASAATDADQDGLAGEEDRCPDEPEDVDDHDDTDGCPDPDDDEDRILDANDECRTEPEDEDGFEDENGCPDPDNDSDQVLDAADRCATEAEDRDSFQDEDGCPDPDNDGDGKNDADDACPNEPQTGTSTDGCPQRLRVDAAGAVRLLEPIQFRGAALNPASNGVLDDLAAVLRGPNAPARITLRVFLHPAGAAPALLTMTQRRADALKAALVAREVPAEKIDATGQGGATPLVEGNTPDARRQNERVEVQFTR